MPSPYCSNLPIPSQALRRTNLSYKHALTATLPPQLQQSRLCYDTGTVPDTITSDKSLFTSYTPFQRPTSIVLGDDATVIPALGKGLIDIVINDTQRFQCYAVLTTKTPTILFSAAEHSKYTDCHAKIDNQQIDVYFPSFHFTVHASQQFECMVSSGINSSLPILWSPTTSTLASPTMTHMNVTLLHPRAILPHQTTPESSGYDISSVETTTILPGATHQIHTGISIEYPSHLDCQLRPRRGLSSQSIILAFGTINSNPRGEIKAIIHNLSNKPFEITRGQRIGQLVFCPIAHP